MSELYKAAKDMRDILTQKVTGVLFEGDSLQDNIDFQTILRRLILGIRKHEDDCKNDTPTK